MITPSERKECSAFAYAIDIDGVRIEFNNGWGLLRASNTTPNLVLRFEAESEEDLQLIKNSFKEILKKIDPDFVTF